MCIFTQPIDAVNNTQIFARMSASGTQLLAYQLQYESNDVNAMILPVPIRQPVHDDSLRFIDLNKYSNFFGDLARGFPEVQPWSIGCAANKTAASEGLKVFKVGNYIASFVPSLSDFERLDARFKLSDGIWSKLPIYADYGFAVFQLAAGSLKPHPMAFEFHSRQTDLFFPTIHIHDGMIHQVEEFDHVLYMQHAGLDSIVGEYVNSEAVDQSTQLVRSKHLASKFCKVEKTQGLVAGHLLVHRKIMRGSLANRDTIITTCGDPLRRNFNLRPWLRYAPSVLIVTALAWLFHRRRKLSQGSINLQASRNQE